MEVVTDYEQLTALIDEAYLEGYADGQHGMEKATDVRKDFEPTEWELDHLPAGVLMKRGMQRRLKRGIDTSDLQDSIIKFLKEITRCNKELLSDKLEVHEDMTYLDGKPYDDRVKLIMAIRLMMVEIYPNLDFRSQVYDYFNKEKED